MEETPQFRVGYETPSDDIGVVVLEGEIDIYSAPEFKEVLVNSIEGGAHRIIVDLTEVTFIDSTALGVLVTGSVLAALPIRVFVVLIVGLVKFNRNDWSIEDSSIINALNFIVVIAIIKVDV